MITSKTRTFILLPEAFEYGSLKELSCDHPQIMIVKGPIIKFIRFDEHFAICS